MEEIEVFRIHTERMDRDKFVEIGAKLGLKGDVVVTDEALFVRDDVRALAYAQPGAKFAGLLFYIDQSQGLTEPLKEAPDPGKVDAWSRRFLDQFRLGPKGSDDRVRVSFQTRAVVGEARVEDSDGRRQRVRRVPVTTDLVSVLQVNDRYVTGPRAKVRMTFKRSDSPALIHRGLWEKLEVFESRPLRTEEEAKEAVASRLIKRREGTQAWKLLNLRLAYFASEYTGGPDLLVPYWFAEVEMRGPAGSDARLQRPRQLLQLVAVR